MSSEIKDIIKVDIANPIKPAIIFDLEISLPTKNAKNHKINGIKNNIRFVVNKIYKINPTAKEDNPLIALNILFTSIINNHIIFHIDLISFPFLILSISFIIRATFHCGMW